MASARGSSHFRSRCPGTAPPTAMSPGPVRWPGRAVRCPSRPGRGCLPAVSAYGWFHNPCARVAGRQASCCHGQYAGVPAACAIRGTVCAIAAAAVPGSGASDWPCDRRPAPARPAHRAGLAGAGLGCPGHWPAARRRGHAGGSTGRQGDGTVPAPSAGPATPAPRRG